MSDMANIEGPLRIFSGLALTGATVYLTFGASVFFAVYGGMFAVIIGGALLVLLSFLILWTAVGSARLDKFLEGLNPLAVGVAYLAVSTISCIYFSSPVYFEHWLSVFIKI